MQPAAATAFALPGFCEDAGTAPEEAIFLAMNALLRPGDHVITIFPAYQSLYEIALWAAG
ncbi:MAG: hypothetical protein ONB53_12370 [candidate division KSB1 bacterium]|nr:hypothetical protein [candidate division KSB1 bacterium]MDZ7416755.1 hypothetical protein [candidate division KSB1 bacterium]